MGEETKIEWTNHTFNPWWGCARVSPGCRFCYADRDASRYGHNDLWRRHGERRMLSDATWNNPVKWNRDAERAGVPAKVFCASMADVFEDHPQVVDARKRLWDLIDSTPWLIWQLLTKRPENVTGMAPWGDSWPRSVWLGASVEDQIRADQRIPVLEGIPAAVRFLSCEPLLGPVTLPLSKPGHQACPCWSGYHFMHRQGARCGCEHCDRVGIDWVIVGGESGPKARPMHPDWARSLRDQCVHAGVPLLFKQWGEWSPNARNHKVTANRFAYQSIRFRPTGEKYTANDVDNPETGYSAPGMTSLLRVGKRAAGRELDGRTWDQYPEVVTP